VNTISVLCTLDALPASRVMALGHSYAVLSVPGSTLNLLSLQMCSPASSTSVYAAFPDLPSLSCSTPGSVSVFLSSFWWAMSALFLQQLQNWKSL
jgi:hypothetical protein